MSTKDKGKAPPPDKEWESDFDQQFRDNQVDGYVDNTTAEIKDFIRNLLKAKDQEADRRVKEAVEGIERFLFSKPPYKVISPAGVPITKETWEAVKYNILSPKGE